MLIFHMSVFWDKIFSWVPTFFDLVTLTLMFDPLIKNFNLGYNFWMVYTRKLIFHMIVPCDKMFSYVPHVLTLWPWRLTYLLKTLTLAIIFKWYVLGCWYFTWVFLETRYRKGLKMCFFQVTCPTLNISSDHTNFSHLEKFRKTLSSMILEYLCLNRRKELAKVL